MSILLGELHTVVLVAAGISQTVATGDLCGDLDTFETLRAETCRSVRGDRAAVSTAFDAAFDLCERRPGNNARGVCAFDGGEIVVMRRLAS